MKMMKRAYETRNVLQVIIQLNLQKVAREISKWENKLGKHYHLTLLVW